MALARSWPLDTPCPPPIAAPATGNVARARRAASMALLCPREHFVWHFVVCGECESIVRSCINLEFKPCDENHHVMKITTKLPDEIS